MIIAVVLDLGNCTVQIVFYVNDFVVYVQSLEDWSFLN